MRFGHDIIYIDSYAIGYTENIFAHIGMQPYKTIFKKESDILTFMIDAFVIEAMDTWVNRIFKIGTKGFFGSHGRQGK